MRHFVRSLPLLALALLAACGGGGGDAAPISVTTPTPPPPPVTGTQSYVHLTSDSGDPIGAGTNYSYTKATALITLTPQGNMLSVTVAGSEQWSGTFQLPNTATILQVGVYAGLTRYPNTNAASGGLDWSGEGRACNTLTGSFTITKVVYSGGLLSELALQFTQNCNGTAPALHGDLYWNVADATMPPGPAAIPAGLWQPAAGTTPATGSYVYLESQVGDFIGAGNTYLYTKANALLTATLQSTGFGITVSGDQGWTGGAKAMWSLAQLATGYYDGTGRGGFNVPITGSFAWSGEGRGCSRTGGWFTVDSLVVANGVLQSIDLRFEQHCDGLAPALHGKIHWDASDTTAPPGPVSPPPTNLWQPAAGATPASGNYVYLESQPGDFIGAGGTYLYTQANAVLATTTSAALLSVTVNGDQGWGGAFQGMTTLTRLQAGYYGNLERYPFNNPATGGLAWTGNGRACNTLNGWFVIDSIAYSGSTLVSVDVRFEQHCEGAAAALHGKIHWDSGDTTAPPGPVSPPPAGLWQPAAGITPASGNYVYLESQPGDFVGAGGNYLYTQANALLSTTSSGALLSIGLLGDESWAGEFQAMNTLTLLQPGYYGNLSRYPFNNPTTGGMSWNGNGRGCNVLTGWFVIDSIVYSGNTVTSVDLRFEQHCEGAAAALHGKIHWSVGDPTTPPGPVVPAPAGLWQPTPGITPASGNFIYLESQSGDFIGLGGNYLYTPANATLGISTQGAHLDVAVQGKEQWTGVFQAMNTLQYLQLGYYGNLEGFPFNNPTKGGLSWYGQGRGCNMVTGWFVIDNVAYTGVTLTAIDLRFEQHCEGGVPALRGQIHWVAP
jgi:hypothetical protein